MFIKSRLQYRAAFLLPGLKKHLKLEQQSNYFLFYFYEIFTTQKNNMKRGPDGINDFIRFNNITNITFLIFQQ